MTADGVSAGRHRLDIYVGGGCATCATASELATIVSSWQVPALDIRVVDLSQPGSVRPPIVFAVPTYVLDEQVISLGNPTEEDLLAVLCQHIGDLSCP